MCIRDRVGETEFDLKNRIARARVPEGEVDLTDVHVTELKLGPRDITTIDPPKEELTDFTSVRYVEVSYHDVRERWSLYVTPTDVTVQLTGADAWTSVIWLSGTGLSGTEMGFRYRKAGDETWLEVPDVTVTGSTFTARLAAEPETEYQVLAYSGDKQTDPLTAVSYTHLLRMQPGVSIRAQSPSRRAIWRVFMVTSFSCPTDERSYRC